MFKFKTLTKSVLALVVAAPVAFSTTGCTNEEVAVGVGAIAIVAGVTAIAAGTSDNRRHDDDYYDRHGRRRGGHRGHPHHPRGGRWNAELKTSALQLQSDAHFISSKYNIDFAAAERLTSALVASQHGDLQPIHSLGLNNDDLKRIATFRKPKKDSINNLAINLGVSFAQANSLVDQLLRDVKTQAADDNSPYWQACTAGGLWKTDQNMGCKETWWAGCSVASGTSMCAAIR